MTKATTDADSVADCLDERGGMRSRSASPALPLENPKSAPPPRYSPPNGLQRGKGKGAALAQIQQETTPPEPAKETPSKKAQPKSIASITPEEALVIKQSGVLIRIIKSKRDITGAFFNSYKPPKECTSGFNECMLEAFLEWLPEYLLENYSGFQVTHQQLRDFRLYVSVFPRWFDFLSHERAKWVEGVACGMNIQHERKRKRKGANSPPE